MLTTKAAKCASTIVRAIALVACCFFAATSANAGWFSDALAADETVQLANTTAKAINATEASIRVHAWVFEREARRGALPLFAKYLGVDREQMSPTEREQFERRARLFFVDVQSGKQLFVNDTHDITTKLPKTNSNGVAQAIVKAPRPQILVESSSSATRDRTKLESGHLPLWIDFRVEGPTETFAGRALLVEDQGLSVVSDIDDTIRDTHILDRHEMLMNTFVREWRPVPGMSDLYRNLAQTRFDSRFHYVSNSPFALYPLLHDFLETEYFPQGSMHLRAVSLKSSLWRKLRQVEGPSPHKLQTISTLITDFPERQFVLVGDTGEFDPEIYAEVARRFPQQVKMIWLREVQPDVEGSDQKLKQTMAGVPTEKWRRFFQASEVNLDMQVEVAP